MQRWFAPHHFFAFGIGRRSKAEESCNEIGVEVWINKCSISSKYTSIIRPFVCLTNSDNKTWWWQHSPVADRQGSYYSLHTCQSLDHTRTVLLYCEYVHCQNCVQALHGALKYSRIECQNKVPCTGNDQAHVMKCPQTYHVGTNTCQKLLHCSCLGRTPWCLYLFQNQSSSNIFAQSMLSPHPNSYLEVHGDDHLLSSYHPRTSVS